MKETRTPKPLTIFSFVSATPSSFGSVSLRKAGIQVKKVAFLSAKMEKPIPSRASLKESEKRVL